MNTPKIIISLTAIALLALALGCKKSDHKGAGEPCKRWVCTTIHTAYGHGTSTTDTTECLTQSAILTMCDSSYINNDSIFHQVSCQ